MDGEMCVVDIGRPTKFRSTSVKLYYTVEKEIIYSAAVPAVAETVSAREAPAVVLLAYKDTIIVDVPLEFRHRQRQRLLQFQHLYAAEEMYLTHKELRDLELAIKLQGDGTIKTPGAPFEESVKQEVNSLLASGVFEFQQYNTLKLKAGTCIFNSRFINEVKGKTTVLYEKSRLIIQAYNDKGKEVILT